MYRVTMGPGHRTCGWTRVEHHLYKQDRKSCRRASFVVRASNTSAYIPVRIDPCFIPKQLREPSSGRQRSTATGTTSSFSVIRAVAPDCFGARVNADTQQSRPDQNGSEYQRGRHIGYNKGASSAHFWGRIDGGMALGCVRSQRGPMVLLSSIKVTCPMSREVWFLKLPGRKGWWSTYVRPGDIRDIGFIESHLPQTNVRLQARRCADKSIHEHGLPPLRQARRQRHTFRQYP